MLVQYVPYVVDLLASIVESRGLENQGIYRVPGNTGAVNSLMQQLDRGPMPDPGPCIDGEGERGGLNDLNVVSSLLKLFFRKLPEALITEGKLGRVFSVLLAGWKWLEMLRF